MEDLIIDNETESNKSHSQSSDGDDSHEVPSDNASPLVVPDTVKKAPYDCSDIDNIQSNQVKLKSNCYSYELYADSPPDERSHFNARVAFMNLLFAADSKGISLLWSGSLNRARPAFEKKSVREEQNQSDTNAASTGDGEGDFSEIIKSVDTVLKIIKCVASENGKLFPFLNTNLLEFDKVDKVVHFLAHPLHYNYGPLLVSGENFGLKITAPTLLALYEADTTNHRDVAAEVRKLLSKSLTEEKHPMHEKIDEEIVKASHMQLATFAHRWLMGLQRTTLAAKHYLSPHIDFLNSMVSAMDSFLKTNRASGRSALAKRTHELLTVIVGLADGGNEAIWRRSIHDFDKSDLQTISSLLTTDHAKQLLSNMDGVEGTNVRALFPPLEENGDLNDLIVEVSGNRYRGLELLLVTVIKRLTVIVDTIISLSNDLQLEFIFHVAKEESLLVVNIEHPGDGPSFILSREERYHDTETVKDIGFRLDGRLLVVSSEVSSQSTVISQTVKWSASREPGFAFKSDMTPAELFNKDCIIKAVTKEGTEVTIRTTNGFKTEIEGHRCQPCKPRFFDVEEDVEDGAKIPCQRIALIWDGAKNGDCVNETAVDIAQAYEFEYTLQEAQKAKNPIPPLPDVIKLFTTKAFRKTYLIESEKLLSQEWTRLSTEFPMATDVLEEKYWLLILPPSDISRLTVYLSKAKFQVKRETADQQSFISKIQELKTAEQEGNTVVQLTLLGDVSGATFRYIAQLEKTTLRVIMAASAATHRLYNELPKNESGKCDRVYIPDDFDLYANIQKGALSQGDPSTLARIASTPPRALDPKLLIDTFRAFVKEFAQRTAMSTSAGDIVPGKHNNMAVYLLTCPENIRKEYFNHDAITMIDDFGNDVPDSGLVGLDVATDLGEQKGFTQRCHNSKKCTLLVIWSESRFRSDTIQMYTKGFRSLTKIIHWRSKEPEERVSFDEFIAHFPICQFLNRVACERLWGFLTRAIATQAMCQRPEGRDIFPEGESWPIRDWEEPWECAYKYSIPETSSTSLVDVITKDLDNYVFGDRECNWSELHQRGFGSSDALFMTCLAAVPHKLRLLCAMPEKQLNTALSQQVNKISPFSEGVFAYVGYAFSCPLVHQRLADLATVNIQCPNVGLIKWNLWSFNDNKLFTPQNLLEAMSVPQVTLTIPRTVRNDTDETSESDETDESLKNLLQLIITLDEPTGPVSRSAFDLQPSIREWVLEKAKVASQEKYIIGSALQRLLLRVRDRTNNHSWRMESWGAFEPLFRKKTSENLSWLSRVSPQAQAVIIAALPPTHSDNVITKVVELLIGAEGACTELAKSATNNSSQFSSLNAAKFVAEAVNHVVGAELCEDLKFFHTIKVMVDRDCDPDTLKDHLRDAMNSWKQGTFKFDEINVVETAFAKCLTQETVSELLRTIRYICGPSNNIDFLRAQKSLCRKTILAKDGAAEIQLLAALWFKAPDSPLPEVSPFEMCNALRPLKNDTEWRDFANFVNQNVGLLPPFALALCDLHEYLDDLTYTQFNENCKLGWPALETQTILVATEASVSVMSAHTVSFTARVISSATLASVGVCKGTFVLGRKGTDLDKVRFDLNSGVSRTSVQLNLQALTHGCAFDKSKMKTFNAPSDSQQETDRFFLRALIVTWFQSFGIYPDDIPSLVGPQYQADIKAVITELKVSEPQCDTNGVWVIAFPSSTCSCVQLKSSALRLFGTDANSKAYTQLKLRSCYEACGPATPATRNPGALDEYQTGYIAASRFSDAYLSGVSNTTPVNALVPPLTHFADLCRQTHRCRCDISCLANLLQGYVKGSVNSNNSACRVAYAISALILSIGFATATAQHCLKVLYRTVGGEANAKVLSSVNRLLSYLLETTFVEELPKIADKVHPVTEDEIKAQNTLLTNQAKHKINSFDLICRLPRPQLNVKLESMPPAELAPHEPAVYSLGSYFGNQVLTSASEGSRDQQCEVAVPYPKTIIADTILTVCLDEEKLNPYFLRLRLLSGFSISLIKRVTASGGEGLALVRELTTDAAVEQKFSTTLDAWRYCCTLPPGSVLVAKGFFLLRSKNYEWILYFSYHPTDSYEPPTALHFLASNKILQSSMGDKVGKLLCHICNLAEKWDARSGMQNFSIQTRATDDTAPNSGEQPLPNRRSDTNVRRQSVAEVKREGRLTYTPKEKQKEFKFDIGEVNSYFLYGTALRSGRPSLNFIHEIVKFFSLAHGRKADVDTKKFQNEVTTQSVLFALNLQTEETISILKDLNKDEHLMRLISEALIEIQAYDEFEKLIFSPSPNADSDAQEPFLMAFAENETLKKHFNIATGSVSSWWENLGVSPAGLSCCNTLNPNQLIVSERGVSIVPAQLGLGNVSITAGMSDCVQILVNGDYYEKKDEKPAALATHFMYTPPLVEHLNRDTYGGLTLGFLFDTRVLDEDILDSNLISEFKRWLYFVASAPIPANIQSWLTGTAVTALHVNVPELPENREKEVHIIVRCLADRCPLKDRRLTLVNSLNQSHKQNPELAEICIRADSRYGVVCVTDVGPAYAGETYSSQYTWVDGRTEEEQYLRIIRSFGKKTTHVIVRMDNSKDRSWYETAPRSLFKWVAEYTEQHPWHFIVFERFYTFHCEPELRDRIINRVPPQPPTARFKSGTVQFVLHTQKDIEKVVREESILKTSVANDDFKTFIKDRVEAPEPFVIALESSPGLGKTYAMRQLEIEAKCNFFRIDASDARLVTETMIEVLEKTLPFGPEGPPKEVGGEERVQCALVVDEFHLTRSDQKKRELANWVMPRLSWLKLILISNRSDAVDADIVEQFRNCIKAEQVKKIRAYLTSTIIDRAYGDDKSLEGRRELFTTTLLTLRLIFGSEASSLRLKTYFCGGTIENVRREVTAVIADKLIMFGDTAPQEVLSIIFSQFTSLEPVLHSLVARLRDWINNVSATTDPIKLITMVVLYAVATNGDDGRPIANHLKDFEEFSAKLYDIHPVARIYYWLLYILGECDEAMFPSKDSILISLQKLVVVNQDRFPIILGVSTGCCSLLSARAVLTEGDFTDPKWMADTINSGKQFNWADVKEEWRHLSFIDPVGLDRLIGVMRRQPGNLVSAIPSRIAFRILSENPFQISLRKLFIDHMSVADIAIDCLCSDSAYFMAVWCQVKCQNQDDWSKNPTRCLIDCLSLNRPQVAAAICRSNGYDVAEAHVLDVAAAILVKWVSTHIASGERVPGDQAANLCLTRMLAQLTNRLYDMQRQERIILSIWCGTLAGLIPISASLSAKVKSKEACKNDISLDKTEYLGIAILCDMVAGIDGALPPDWPIALTHLKAVLSREANEEATRSVASMIQSDVSSAPEQLLSAFFVSPHAADHLPLLRLILSTEVSARMPRPDSTDLEVIRKNIEKSVVAFLNVTDIKIRDSIRLEALEQWQLLHKGDVDGEPPSDATTRDRTTK